MPLRSLPLVEGGGQGKYAKIDFEVTAATEVQSSIGSRGEKDKAICGLFYSPHTKEKKCFFAVLMIFLFCLVGNVSLANACLSLKEKKKKGCVLRCFSHLMLTVKSIQLCFQA